MSQIASKGMQFVEDTEFHGIKNFTRMSLPRSRRVIWAVIFVAAAVGFCIFAALRISYFLSYPFSTRIKVILEDVPVPAVALCPPRRYRILVSHSPISWQNYSDAEFVYMSWLIYGTNLVNTSHIRFPKYHTLNHTTLATLKGFFSNGTLRPIDLYENRNLSMAYFPQQIITDMVTMSSFAEKLNSLPLDMRLDYKADFLKMLRENGVFPGHIPTCTFTNGKLVSVDCKKDLQLTFTDQGSCLSLKTVGGSNLTFNMVDGSEVYNLLLISALDENIHVYIYNPNDVPNFYYDTLLMSHAITKNQEITLDKVITVSELGYPYQRFSCSHTSPKSHCVQQCLERSMTCALFYFSSQTLLTQPFCSMKDQISPPDQILLKKCKDECPRACARHKFMFRTSKGYNDQNFIMMQGDASAYLEQFQEIPLFSSGALLAELGGYLGLFLGASLLTVFHLLEFFSSLLFWPCPVNLRRK